MKNDKKTPKILVVDDELRNVRFLSMILTTEGYEILPAYSGEEAVKKARTESPDLIVLDIMMPHVDGYEVCRKLRKYDKTKAIPIVMVTALRSLEDKIKALDTGADDFISKPIDKSELLASVRSRLRVKYLYDELADSNQELIAQNELLKNKLMMAKRDRT
jgi:DNA-binding response OmpR family regulator